MRNANDDDFSFVFLFGIERIAYLAVRMCLMICIMLINPHPAPVKWANLDMKSS